MIVNRPKIGEKPASGFTRINYRATIFWAPCTDSPIVIEPLNAPDLDPAGLEGFNYFSLRVLVNDVVSLDQVVVGPTPCQSLLKIVLIQQFATEIRMSRVQVSSWAMSRLFLCGIHPSPCKENAGQGSFENEFQHFENEFQLFENKFHYF